MQAAKQKRERTRNEVELEEEEGGRSRVEDGEKGGLQGGGKRGRGGRRRMKRG